MTTPLPLKKRGRKPNNMKAKLDDDITPQITTEQNQTVKLDGPLSSSSMNTPLILHLNLAINDETSVPDTQDIEHYKSFESSFYNYSPIINEPIAYEENTLLSSLPEIYKDVDDKSNLSINSSIKQMFGSAHECQDTDIDNRERYTNKSNAVLLKDMVYNREWCEHTNYHCYWDCHPFDNPPFGIPIKYKNNKFHVFGCFCSLECAVAYNFYENEKTDSCWENYNLINLLSNKINYKRCVNPSISRKCLTIFGGPLDIIAFRLKNAQNKHYHVLTYPMVSLMEQVEEINETIPYHKNYIPLDKTRIEKIEEANKEIIMSKRKSSLEKKMELKFIN